MDQPKSTAEQHSSQFPTRREAILASGSAIAAMLSPAGNSLAEDNRQSPSERNLRARETLDGPADASRPDLFSDDWEPLTYLIFKDLESVTLIPVFSPMGSGQDPKVFPKTRFPLFLQVYYEETNPALLRYLNGSLSLSLCYTLHKGYQGGIGGAGMTIGMLRLRTKVDTIWVAITRIGFALADEGSNPRNLFFSPALARGLNLIYQKAAGEPLPPLIAEALSGEREIRQQFEYFAKWEASQAPKGDPKTSK